MFTPIRIKLAHWSNHCKEYLAKIDGLHSKFGLNRVFVRADVRCWSRSGKNGATYFVINEPGYYEIQEPGTGIYGGKGARRWIAVDETGTVTDCTEKEIRQAFGAQDIEPRSEEAARSRQEIKTNEVDDAINRVNFNQEGGFAAS